MDKKIRNNIIKYHEGIVYFSTAIAFLIVFLVGLARYRTILFYALFSISKSVFSVKKLNQQILYYLLLPGIVIMIYLDVRYGQIFPLFNINIIISIISLVIVETLVEEWTKKKIQKISGNKVFQVCPSCNYNNRLLVEICSHCNYRYQGENVDAYDDQNDHTMSIKNIDNVIFKEREEYKRLKLFKSPPSRIKRSLKLLSDESILICIRIDPLNSYYKNGNKEVASYLVLTNKRIFIIDFPFYERGWRTLEIINYNDVTQISITEKREYTKKEPILRIQTRTNIYEFTFRINFEDKIKGIIDCIKKRKPDVSIEKGL